MRIQGVRLAARRVEPVEQELCEVSAGFRQGIPGKADSVSLSIASRVCVSWLFVVVSCFGWAAAIAAPPGSGDFISVNPAAAAAFPSVSPARPAEPQCPLPVSEGGPSAAANTTTASFKARNRDRSCLVTVAAAEKQRLKSDVRYVDVRSPAEFEQYRISESINIPLHLVKTKNFLKNSPVVLVNDGRSTAELEQVCQELRQGGFRQVTVLENGLNAWRENARPLAGDTFAQARLNRMSPGELSVERLYSDWLVLDVSTPGKFKDLRQWLPPNVVVVSIKSGADPAASMRALIAKHRKTNPQGRVLLVADDNQAYARLDARLQKGGTISALRLEGGLTGYRDFMSRQIAMWNQQNKPRKLPSCRG
jgi:rhodanese-related sulfurtransferase